MKKIFYFTIALASILALQSCQTPLTPEDAGRVILEGERGRIPLYMQEYELKNLTIDSLCFLNTVEPMSALLYTTWTYDETIHGFLHFHSVEKKVPKTQSIIIQINNIQRSKENSDIVEWYSNWAAVNLKIDRAVFDW